MTQAHDLKDYLREMIYRADLRGASTDHLRATIWQHFLPDALRVYGTSGVLQAIAAQVEVPDVEDDDLADDIEEAA